MVRKIKLSDVKSAVKQAYDKYVNMEGGTVDPLVAGMNDGKFALSLRLIDGTKFDVGHTQDTFAMGTIAKIPMLVQLATQQITGQELAKRFGLCKCGSSCKCTTSGERPTKGLHVHGVLDASMVEPTGDYDGKMTILSNLMINLMGSSPVLDDKLYKASQEKDIADNKINRFADLGIELYDASDLSIDLYTRLRSLLVTTEQLALMGATVAADGVNPESNVPVFDGALSAGICSSIAAKGPKHMGKPWLMITGTPAMCGFGGGFIAIIPGFGAIAGMSPELNEAGVPAKAAMAIKDIIETLGLNAFASARVEVEQ